MSENYNKAFSVVCIDAAGKAVCGMRTTSRDTARGYAARKAGQGLVAVVSTESVRTSQKVRN